MPLVKRTQKEYVVGTQKKRLNEQFFGDSSFEHPNMLKLMGKKKILILRSKNCLSKLWHTVHIVKNNYS